MIVSDGTFPSEDGMVQIMRDGQMVWMKTAEYRAPSDPVWLVYDPYGDEIVEYCATEKAAQQYIAEKRLDPVWANTLFTIEEVAVRPETRDTPEPHS